MYLQETRETPFPNFSLTHVLEFFARFLVKSGKIIRQSHHTSADKSTFTSPAMNLGSQPFVEERHIP